MQNKKTLEIGSSDFRDIIEGNNYFVDKTMFIYEFFNRNSKVALISRPRRFGKTLNLSMLEYFFDIRKKRDNNLFSHLKISKNKSFCETHQNKHPVINITLKNIDESDWENCLESLKSLISEELYEKHSYLLDSTKLSFLDKKNFKDILLEKASLSKYKKSIFYLSKYLRKHFNKKVIILVDEYDAPIINAFRNSNFDFEKKYYNNVINFMQTFLGSVFKGNEENLQKGLLTGVMRVGKESLFSKWNNLDVFGITSKYFSEYFGFTEKETKDLLSYFNLENNFENVKKWYDGYVFGDTDKIYNPWSIVNYISDNEEDFKAYWVNTSADTLIREKIIENEIEGNDFKKIMSNESIKKKIYENFAFPDFEFKKDLIWTLFVYSGYLTQIKKAKYNTYEIKIPNYEVRTVFEDIIVDWFSMKTKVRRDLLISMAENLINNRMFKFEKDFREIVGNTISYFDKGKEAERIYHVYTLGLLAILSDDYIIKSNGESGDGRYDILLIPRDKKLSGIVIEFKIIEKRKNNEKDEKIFHKRINKSLEKALYQINKNQYYLELLDNKIPEKNIIKVSIVFAGKKPYVNLIKI